MRLKPMRIAAKATHPQNLARINQATPNVVNRWEGEALGVLMNKVGQRELARMSAINPFFKAKIVDRSGYGKRNQNGDAHPTCAAEKEQYYR